MTHHDPSIERRDINRVALLTNPAAGKGGATHRAKAAMEAFYDYGVDVVSISGSSAEASRDLAREMIEDESIDALVACGGDGLINLALQEQVGSDTPLGIIPGGTGNDHAREYHVPLDPRRAAKLISQGYCVRTDIAKARNDHGQERYFGTIMCTGFDAIVNDRTNAIRWPSGQARYVLAAAIEFARFHSIPATITLDGKEVIEQDITLCAIGNTRTYGGGMMVCPDADHHDGLFDITLVSKLSRTKALQNFPRIFSGDIRSVQEVRQIRARKVRIEMPKITAYADGEPFFPSPVECEIVPNAGLYLTARP